MSKKVKRQKRGRVHEALAKALAQERMGPCPHDMNKLIWSDFCTEGQGLREVRSKVRLRPTDEEIEVTTVMSIDGKEDQVSKHYYPTAGLSLGEIRQVVGLATFDWIGAVLKWIDPEVPHD